MQRFLDSRLSLRQLRAIAAIDNCGSLSRAAVSLGVTQSALSKSLHEAEAILQIKVFERSAKGTVRSPRGDGTVIAAKTILATLKRLEDDLDRSGGGSVGTVTIGALPSVALGLLPTFLASVDEHLPGLQVRVIEGLTNDLLVQLSSGEIDLVLGRIYRGVEDDRFFAEPLYDEPLAVIARPNHPLFSTSTTLADFEAVLPTYSERFGREIETFAERIGLRNSNLVRAGSVGFLCEILQVSDMITVLPALMVAGPLQRGILRALSIEEQQAKRPSGLIWFADRPAAKGAERLASFLRKGIRHLAEERGVIRPLL